VCNLNGAGNFWVLGPCPLDDVDDLPRSPVSDGVNGDIDVVADRHLNCGVLNGRNWPN
jgi:hypothetical protein